MKSQQPQYIIIDQNNNYKQLKQQPSFVRCRAIQNAQHFHKKEEVVIEPFNFTVQQALMESGEWFDDQIDHLKKIQFKIKIPIRSITSLQLKQNYDAQKFQQLRLSKVSTKTIKKISLPNQKSTHCQKSIYHKQAVSYSPIKRIECLRQLNQSQLLYSVEYKNNQLVQCVGTELMKYFPREFIRYISECFDKQRKIFIVD